MRAAIIAPGPSVLKTFDDDFAGLRIAVNRAALWFTSDLWAAGDCPLIESIGDGVKGSPLLWSKPETIDSLKRHGNPWHGNSHPFSMLACPVPAWDLYTAPAALVLAAYYGATEISVYGADWTEEADADGDRPVGCRRTAERWTQEREIWAWVMAWLAGLATVERILQ